MTLLGKLAILLAIFSCLFILAVDGGRSRGRNRRSRGSRGWGRWGSFRNRRCWFCPWFESEDDDDADGGWGTETACENQCSQTDHECIQSDEFPFKWFCELVVTTTDCGPLTAPANGNVSTPNGTLVGEQAIYTCGSGFTLIGGTNPRVCQSDSNWSGTEPVCVIDCGPLAAPVDGFVTLTGTQEGDTATFSCCIAHTLPNGTSNTSICQSDGTWSESTPTCSLVDCGSPVVMPNMEVELVSGAEFENIAIYYCNEIYHGFLSCFSTGEWAGVVPPCFPESVCPAPDVPVNGGVTVTLEELVGGATATYDCDPGYTLIGPSEVYCQLVAGSDPVWSDEPPVCCMPCPELSAPANGDIVSTGNLEGDTVTVTCDLAFELSTTGSDYLTCLSNGTWDGTMATCVPVDCGPPPNVTYATAVIAGAGTVFESLAIYTCEPGYLILGGPFMSCSSTGIWLTIPPICAFKQLCPDPASPDNGMVEVNFDENVGGATASYECSPGYTLIGPSEVVCQLVEGSNPVWSDGPPVCCMPCPELSAPANGDIVSTGNLEGDTITVTCDLAFELSTTGSDFLTCLSNGTWDGTMATCVPVDCGALSNPTNGMAVSSGTDFESQVDYSCSPGFELIGPSYRICQSDTSWSQSEPSCQLVDCGPLDCPCNGDVLVTDTTFGSSANYTCSVGYILIGNTTRTCLDTGLWDGEPPCCLDLPT